MHTLFLSAIYETRKHDHACLKNLDTRDDGVEYRFPMDKCAHLR